MLRPTLTLVTFLSLQAVQRLIAQDARVAPPVGYANAARAKAWLPAIVATPTRTASLLLEQAR